MRRVVRLYAVLVLLGPLTGSAQTQAPAFPAGTERVIVDVVVTDAQGRPVSGLTREDFRLEEEGTAQTIVEFEAIDVMAGADAAEEPRPPSSISSNAAPRTSPRVFLVLFDDLGLSPHSADKVRRALRGFFETKLRDSDCVTLVPSAGGAWWSGCLGEDRADLTAALEAPKGRRLPDTSQERMSDEEARRIDVHRDAEAIQHVALRYAALGLALPMEPGLEAAGTLTENLQATSAAGSLVRSIARDVYARARQRSESVLRSLERALLALGGGRGRRAVILASDGFVQDEALPGFRRVRDAARRSNAALYFVDARTLAGTETRGGPELPMLPDPENNYRYASLASEYAAAENAGSEGLAADTGGFRVSGNDLESGLGRISGESRMFYLLGYEPSERKQDGRFRKIQVEVRRPGVKVRARKGYYAGRAVAEKPTAEGPPPEARVALDALDERRAIPLRMTAYVFGNAADGRARVLLNAEADPAGLTLAQKADRFAGAIQSYSTVAARDTGEVGQKERALDLGLRPEVFRQMATTWLPVTHTYELPPGRYQARMVVVDRDSGRTGSVRHAFDVPLLQGLRLTTPVLTDTLVPDRDPDAPARAVPLARRSFAVGSRLVCSVDVLGARLAEGAPQVEIGYEVRRGEGSIAARADPRLLVPDAKGTLSDLFRLTLNRPGEYELRLRARDRVAGEEAAASERFTVVAAPPAASEAPR